MVRTSNRKCEEYIAQRKDFVASNLNGETTLRNYCVYSYKWYPLAIYIADEDTWYVNTEKYSPTTSRHLHYVKMGIEGPWKEMTKELFDKYRN